MYVFFFSEPFLESARCMEPWKIETKRWHKKKYIKQNKKCYDFEKCLCIYACMLRESEYLNAPFKFIVWLFSVFFFFFFYFPLDKFRNHFPSKSICYAVRLECLRNAFCFLAPPNRNRWNICVKFNFPHPKLRVREEEIEKER